MTSCARCRRTLTREPVVVAGQGYGRVCGAKVAGTLLQLRDVQAVLTEAPPQPIATHRYGDTLVEIFDGFVRTTLPDGSPLLATPGKTPEDTARAHALGYAGDVWAMTRDHDRFHALLAHAFGLAESPALRQALDGVQSELAGAEEEAVLAIQRWHNLVQRSAQP